MAHDLPDALARRTASQLSALRSIFDHAVHEVLGGKHALDRVLSGFWRDNRRYGSRDRRLFSESIFAFFRYYGWLREMLSEEERRALETGNSRTLPGEKAARILLAAWALENLPAEPAHAMLASHFELPRLAAPVSGITAKMRRMRLLPYWTNGELPAWEKLLPDWVIPMLPGALQTEEYFQSLAVRPPLWLRVQGASPERVKAELCAAGLTVVSHPRLANALAVTAGGVNLYTLPAYREGRVEVQDLASQVIAAVCNPQRKSRWWDACAGAGGKTLALAEAMERTGKVVASDIREYKLNDLKLRARRAGFPNVEPRPWDGGKVPPRKAGSFDGVLVDAPCSCAGVWRRNPDGRWNSSPGEILEMHDIQLGVLDHAAPAVAPGGKLVYATCSIFPAEDAEVVKAFLEKHEEFMLEAFENPLTGETVAEGMLTVPGAKENCDSMFVAAMRRKQTIMN